MSKKAARARTAAESQPTASVTAAADDAPAAPESLQGGAAARPPAATNSPAQVDVPLADALDTLRSLPEEARLDARLVVRARQDSRRRAGFTFGRAETLLQISELTPDQLMAIDQDPLLIACMRVTR